MKLIECYIENFGRLSAHRLKFCEGMNAYVHENGYGKTTITAFIKAMLYGLSDTKKSDLEENDRRHYLPWGGGVCGGWLSFLAGTKEYRIERTFGQKAQEDTFAIYDLSLGKPTADFTENVGRELFGIDKDGFERTVFLSERNLSGKNDNKSISEKLSDTSGVDYDMGAMDEALKLLEERRKFYFKRGGGGEISAVEGELKRALSELSALDGIRTEYALEAERLCGINEKIDALKKRRTEAERQIEIDAKEREGRILREHYKKLADEQDKKRARLLWLDDFFKNGVPTNSEIENARTAKIKSAELINPTSDSEEKTELEELSRRFEGISKKDIADALSSSQTDKNFLFPIFLVVGGVLTSLAGIILLFFVPLISLFALPVGVFLLVMSIFVVKSTKDAATNTKKLLKLLPTDKHKSKADELRALYDEYVRFELLCAAFEKDEEHRKIRAVETERLALAADEFLSRYKTQSEHPFDEILGYLNERSAILSSLSELSEIPNFDYSSEDTRGTQTESPKSVFEAIVKEQSRLEGEREHARRRMLTLEGELQREDFIICAVEENKERLDLYTKNLFYIQKSKEFLETARDNMTAKYLGKAKSAFEGYMAQLSQNTGEYMLDTSFEISKNEYGTLKKSEAYSLGIRNMQHLAIRLAIIDALYENESPFIILDDPLISFDDERAALAAELLRKLSKRRQIIYFTCSASRGIG